jgi:protein TonB
MKSTTLRLAALAAVLASIAILPAGAVTGTAFAPVPAASIDQSARPLSQPKPAYAAYLRHAVIEGQVLVSMTVSPRGDVAGATILSSTNSQFNKPTLDALMKWRFQPALKAGVPVSSEVHQVVVFTIPDAPR